MERDRIIDLLREKRATLEALGVRHLALFGSRARGDSSATSDIDLLIDVPEQSRFSLLDLVGIEQFVADATGLQANAFLSRSLDEPFRQTIRPDTVTVF